MINASNLLARAANTLLDWVYPRQCGLCGGPSDDFGGHWCASCLADAHFVQAPFCQSCGLPVAGRIDHAFTCHTCEKLPPAYDMARSAFRYETVIRTAIHHFKYRRAFWLQEDMVNGLEAAWNTHLAEQSPTGVACVPLHHHRMRTRGYNQAALLAASLAARKGLPFLPSLLRRDRDTGSQTKLTAAARRRNVRGAFHVKEFRAATRVPNSVVLIDDVMTTGATVHECARVLKKAGVAQVFVLTLARG